MSNLTIRIDEKLKKAARIALAKQGLDMSTAVKMFFSQVVIEKGIPFLPTHNRIAIAKKWDMEVKEALKGKGYSSAEEMHRDILAK